MDPRESTAHPAHPSTEDQDHLHAYLNGYIYPGYTAVDEQTGEEVERIEALLCRRCASPPHRAWRGLCFASLKRCVESPVVRA